MHDTITITGNVATAPEHKRTAAGVSITTFRVASSQRRFDRATNAWVDGDTNFYSVSAFRRLADHAFHSLRKGERVVLTGRLRVRDWENGAKRGTDVDIEADALGHDLLFGTTVFTKDASTSASDSEARWQPPLADGEGTDGWAAADVPSGSGGADPVTEDAALAAPASDADGTAPGTSRVLQPVGAETPF